MSEWIQTSIESLLDISFAGDWGAEPRGKGKDAIVFRGADFNPSGRLSSNAGVPRNVSEAKLKKVALKPGDILLEKSGGSPDQPVGRVSLFQGATGVATASNFLQTLRPCNGVDSEFLFYLLQYEYRTGRVLPFQQQTTGLINFRLKDYLKEVVTIPSAQSEQRGIAEVLSALDEQIEAAEQGIQKNSRILDGLIDSLLLGDGRTKQLAYFGELGPKTKGVAPTQNVPFVPMDAVTEDGHLSIRQMRPWAQVQSGFTRFSSNDILIAKITPCFENGKGAHVPAGFDVWAGSTEFHVLRAKDGASSRWLYWYTRSREFRESGAGRMTGSAGQQRVPRSFIEEFPVRNLSESEQNEAAESLDALDTVIQEDGCELKKLRLQKQGLTRDLLTGKTRIQ